MYTAANNFFPRFHVSKPLHSTRFEHAHQVLNFCLFVGKNSQLSCGKAEDNDYLNDSFVCYCHDLNRLHEVITWNAFQLTPESCYKTLTTVKFLAFFMFEKAECVVSKKC